jgi:tetratricopeptide (TPR) repeat protein
VTGYHLGRFEESDRWDGFGRALLERLGPGHELAEAWLVHGRGISLARRGEYQRGLRELEAALALKRKVLPADHHDIAISLTSLSAIREDAGDVPGALQAAEQAVELGARAYGRRSPSMAQFLSNRGELLSRVGRKAEAERDLRDAIAGWSTALGPSHPFVAYAETALGKLLVDVGRTKEAVPILERAQAIREKSEPKPDLVAETRFALAHARWETGERAAAIALASSARELYRKQPSQANNVSEVSAWLDAHPIEKGTAAR